MAHKKAKRIATLSAAEDALWGKAFSAAVGYGLSDSKASADAWKELQRVFPRLRKFDGCKA